MSKFVLYALIALSLILVPAFEAKSEKKVPPDWQGPFTLQEHIDNQPHGYPICLVRDADKPWGPTIDCYGGRVCDTIRHMSWGVNGPINEEGSFRDYSGDGVLEMACYVEPFPHHICAPWYVAQDPSIANQHKYIRLIFAYRGNQVIRREDGSAAGTLYFERDAGLVGNSDVALPGTRLYNFWRPGPRNILEGFGQQTFNSHPICTGYSIPCPSCAVTSKQAK